MKLPYDPFMKKNEKVIPLVKAESVGEMFAGLLLLIVLALLSFFASYPFAD